jgi:hypothetical protein
VKRYLALAALTTAAALALALASGPASKPAALLGAALAAGTAFASLLGFGLVGRSPVRPLQKALAVFVVMFLVRLVAVAAGLVVAWKAGWSVPAYAIAFFAPYFVFLAIEGGLVHALGRQQGRTA